VFFHAHPDDEAIFTGGTIARLADLGHGVTVVFATAGELGVGPLGELASIRSREAEQACALLGADRIRFLDHSDSGLSFDPTERPDGAFASSTTAEAAADLAAIVRADRAVALVTYDAIGVYGHPDHVHAHHVGAAAAEQAGLGSWYEVTIDREYLHFVDTHITSQATASLGISHSIGSATVEITTTVDVGSVLERKLSAIGAHVSQIGEDPTMGTGQNFGDVYGYEWFIRHGAETDLDGLAMMSAPWPMQRSTGGSR
jgi:LmbE family N-acetylglucosaminyl deacetylase